MTFEAFPKIARLNRDCVITEKLDGTNGQIWIRLEAEVPPDEPLGDDKIAVVHDGLPYIIMAGSRSKWIRPGKAYDNYNFAAWVWDHADELVTLGPGRHYGEWWGQGIQRNYGIKEKRFSLFNTHRWEDPGSRPACVGCVPVLYRGPFTTQAVQDKVDWLNVNGSIAAPGFSKPEGVIVYHTAQQSLFKVTCEKDESPKGAFDRGVEVWS